MYINRSRKPLILLSITSCREQILQCMTLYPIIINLNECTKYIDITKILTVRSSFRTSSETDKKWLVVYDNKCYMKSDVFLPEM